ncbi:MAG: hypothetical protein AAGL34_17925 [Bacteroidota bacterium]
MKKWENHGGNVNIIDNLNHSDIPKLIKCKDIHTLQFYAFKTPNTKTWNVLNELYEQHPNIGLRIHWFNQMDFLFYPLIPSIRNFDVASYNTLDYTPLLQNKALTDLGIGETKSIAVDLSFISEFRALKTLWIDGMKKGLESVSQLPELERLTFRGIKMKNLDLVSNLRNLKQIRLLFGSYKNLEALSKVKSLKTLEISRTRQIPDYEFFKEMPNLNSLYLEGMSKMEELPDFQGLTNLKRIQIENNSRLTDISSLNSLQSLEIFLIWFPENFKAAFRKSLILQGFEFLINSKTVKYTNLFHWLSEAQKTKLSDKGIVEWNYNLNI